MQIERWRIQATVLLCVFLIPSAGFGQASSNVQLLANINDYSAVGYNDCWGYTDENGREYALLGVRSGTSIVDITDNSNIREVTFIPNPRESSAWKDIKTYRKYAYVVNEAGGGMQIIDLSNLPVSASLAATYTGFATSHNIYIDTAAALLLAEGSNVEPVRVLSLSNPVVPVQVASFGIECHDVFARNGLAYVSEGVRDSIAIYNVSNPASPVLVKRFGLGGGGYAHNAWLSDDGQYLMTTEETVGKGVKLWDLNNLNPVQKTGEYLAPEQLAHNTHIKGRYAYISHYKDGLRIVDISNPANIVEVGFYDTYNGSLLGVFHGAWGAYPFFKSGKVLVSDIESGLYVVYFAGAATTVGALHLFPEDYRLSQNFPNPFNPTTNFELRIANFGVVSLKVFDFRGREIASLVDEELSPGIYTVRWNASGYPSGVYFGRLSAGAFTQLRKILLIR